MLHRVDSVTITFIHLRRVTRQCENLKPIGRLHIAQQRAAAGTYGEIAESEYA
jgi:hypothetical protein